MPIMKIARLAHEDSHEPTERPDDVTSFLLFTWKDERWNCHLVRLIDWGRFVTLIPLEIGLA